MEEDFSYNSSFLKSVQRVPDNFMFFSNKMRKEWLKDVAFQRNIKAKPFSAISISKSQLSLVDDLFIDFIKDNFEDCSFFVDISNDAVLNSDEFNKALKLKNELEQNNVLLYFSEASSFYGFNKVVEANNKLDNWAREINNLTIDGQKLSPLEKYYVAYSYVTQFSYQESNKKDQARNFVSVLTGDRIVCVGYARILKELCLKIGIECDTQVVAVNSNRYNHMNCQVKIDDPKYKIKGIYYADPCYDSLENGESSFSNSLMTYKSISKLFKNHSLSICLDNGFIKNKTFFSNKENIEKSKRDIVDFLNYFKSDFSKYIDDCFYHRGFDRFFTKQPKEKDFQKIIDAIITDRLDLYEFGYQKSPRKDYAISKIRTNMRDTSNLIIKFARKDNLEDFKLKLFKEMENYIPSVDSEAFVTLVDAYTRFINYKKEPEYENEKKSSKELSFYDFEKLLENLSKIEGDMEVDFCKKTNDLIKFSVNRAIKTWGEHSSSYNVFAMLKNVYNQTGYTKQKIDESENVLGDFRELFENAGLILKRPKISLNEQRSGKSDNQKSEQVNEQGNEQQL